MSVFRFYKVLQIVLLLQFSTVAFSQSIIDSLENRLQSVSKTEKAEVLTSLSAEYYYTDLDKSLQFAEEALTLSKELKDKKGEGDALHRKGKAFKKKNEREKALEFFQKAVKIRELINDTIGLARSYNSIGVIYYEKSEYKQAEEYQNKAFKKYTEYGDAKGSGFALNNIGNIYLAWGKFEKAITYFQKAIKIFEEADFKAGVASCLNNIGNINKDLANYNDFVKLEKAIEYYNQALGIQKEIENDYGIADSYNNIGIVHIQIAAVYKDKIDTLSNIDSLLNKDKIEELNLQMNNNFDKAVEYLKLCLDKRRKINDLQGEASALINIGAIFSNKEEDEEALNYFFEALEINNELEQPIEIATTLYYIGQSYINLKHYNEAKRYLNRSKEIAENINTKKIRGAVYNSFSQVFEKQNDFENALTYFKQYHAMFDSLNREESNKAIEEMQTKYETDKKEQEISLLNKDKELKETRIKQQRLLIYVFIVVLFIIVGFIILVFRQYQQKKKANKELEYKNELITHQKQEITDSILYARRIQTAILPPGDYIKNIFPERFIFFKPRDIVSGDFYWVKELKDQDTVIITAADCTGHGVPGAFMSMLGIAFLNEIVNKPEVSTAASILGHLRDTVITSLHQTGKFGEAQDGMDIALCAINFKTKVLEFAGANNPIYYVRNNEFNEIKGDKMPIGIHLRSEEEFTNHKIQLQKDDCIYIFSDGFPDQFGGPKAKKFKYKPFKELLLKIHNLPMAEQEQILDDTFNEWKGDLEQIDDIIVIGIKIT